MVVNFFAVRAGFRRDESVQIGARSHEPVPARAKLAEAERVGQTSGPAGDRPGRVAQRDRTSGVHRQRMVTGVRAAQPVHQAQPDRHRSEWWLTPNSSKVIPNLVTFFFVFFNLPQLFYSTLCSDVTFQ